MSEPVLGKFPVTVNAPVAWGEMDAFGHVNNTVYLRWFESARIAYFERLAILDRLEKDGVGPILARASVDYRLPLRYPDQVKVQATVTKIGNTSFVMGYRLFSAAHGDAAPAAEGEGVIVMVDYKKGGKVPVDDGLKARIAAVESGA